MRAPTRTIQAAQFQPTYLERKIIFLRAIVIYSIVLLEDGGDGSVGVLEVVREDQGHHGAQAEVGQEDDGEREDDGHRHHLLRVDHLLPHGGDHIETHKAVEGGGRPTDDPVQAVGSEASLPAPVVIVRLVPADILQWVYYW